MSAAQEVAPDPLGAVREIFGRNSSSLMRQPYDRELADVAYLAELARGAPVKITHGDGHKKLRLGVRALLTSLPGLIADAEMEVAVARSDGRTTDMGNFALRARELLNAALPFASVAGRRRDVRGAWHAWARMMAQEVRSIFQQCGQDDVSFSHETSAGALIVASLMDKPVGQVIDALRERRKSGK